MVELGLNQYNPSYRRSQYELKGSPTWCFYRPTSHYKNFGFIHLHGSSF